VLTPLNIKNPKDDSFLIRGTHKNPLLDRQFRTTIHPPPENPFWHDPLSLKVFGSVTLVSTFELSDRDSTLSEDAVFFFPFRTRLFPDARGRFGVRIRSLPRPRPLSRTGRLLTRCGYSVMVTSRLLALSRIALFPSPRKPPVRKGIFMTPGLQRSPFLGWAASCNPVPVLSLQFRWHVWPRGVSGTGSTHVT